MPKDDRTTLEETKVGIPTKDLHRKHGRYGMKHTFK